MKKSILETVHDAAKGLHNTGLMDLKTMREFDALRNIASSLLVDVNRSSDITLDTKKARELDFIELSGPDGTSLD
jgi:hypothetical protein